MIVTESFDRSFMEGIPGFPGLSNGSLATKTPVVSDGLLSPASFSAMTLNSYSVPSTRSLKDLDVVVIGSRLTLTNLELNPVDFSM